MRELAKAGELKVVAHPEPGNFSFISLGANVLVDVPQPLSI